jgi:hypothetical protein
MLNPGASSLNRNLARLLLLVGLGIGLAALVLELAVRIFVPVSDFFWETDPVLGVRLIANKHGRSVKPGLFDVPVAINSHGFRDREHSYEKPADIKRILLLGDSYVEALQVPLERSVTALLEKRLRSRDVNAETINLGVSGFGTAREYLMLREYGLKYKPDLVLLFFVGNDLLNNSARLEGKPYLPYPLLHRDRTLLRDQSGEPRFTPIVDTRSRLSFLTSFLKDHSAGFRFLRMTIDRAPDINEIFYRWGLISTISAKEADPANNFGLYEIYRNPATDTMAEARDTTQRLVLEIERLTARHNAKFAVVLVPAPWEVYPNLWQTVLDKTPAMRQVSFDLDKPSHSLTSFLRAHGIMYVDLLPGFRAHANSPALFFEPDNHWTTDGHRLAVDLMIDPVTGILEGSMDRTVRWHKVSRG